jgi:hypothetical protein
MAAASLATRSVSRSVLSTSRQQGPSLARRAASTVNNKGPVDYLTKNLDALEEKHGVSAFGPHVTQKSPVDGNAGKCPFLSQNEILKVRVR